MCRSADGGRSKRQTRCCDTPLLSAAELPVRPEVRAAHGSGGTDESRRLAPSPAWADDPDAIYDAFTDWAGRPEVRLQLYPAQSEALIELVSGSNVILATPTGSGKSLVATGAIFAALRAGTSGRHPAGSTRSQLLHRPDQGAGQREVLRAVRDLRLGPGRHDDRRRQREPGRADHLLHRRGAGQPGPAEGPRSRHRPGRDG